ncbi:MAG: glycosyltransferase family 2 protein [Cyanobacteria bacterium P01_A01_bin.84]
MLHQITPLILSYNESPNIERTLKYLTWAKKIIVVDSYSNDKTLEILQNYPQIKVFKREFDTHTQQWNYGLEQVETPWVLSLDADYIVTDELVTEIANLSENSHIDGYFAKFKYCINGKPLRSTILPPRQVLFRKSQAIYIDDGHTQLLQLNGKSANLNNYIHHDDRKSLNRWLWAQDRYIIMEVKKLLQTPTNKLSLGDRIRKQKVLAPFIIPIYCLVFKGGVLDGWHGWYYAFQRMLAETLLSVRLMQYEKLHIQ